jgi:23S rRNA pseudouridine1911/1915/1917 synthase
VVETEPRQTILTVEHSLPDERLDSYLSTRLAPLSRGAIQRLIRQGHVRIDGQKVKTTRAPRAGERIEIQWPPPAPATARPEKIPLDILFEDDDLLVINKPPGMVVHPSPGHEEGTLVNALLHHCQGRLSGIGGVARPGIVHRLDRDTSGCIVVAKHDDAHVFLSTQFSSRGIEKVYRALVCGRVTSDTGEIRAAIGRHPTHRKHMAVTDGGGREAWTSYRVIERIGPVTLIEACLHTGRTHQVRVHLKHIGHPIVGDSTYGNRQNKQLTEVTGCGAPRQMLHAMRLAFRHPCREGRLVVEAPMPVDFLDTLETLRDHAREQPD